MYVLGSEDLVVHEEEIDVASVVDEESLVSGRGEVTGLLVGTKSDLCLPSATILCHSLIPRMRPSEAPSIKLAEPHHAIKNDRCQFLFRSPFLNSTSHQTKLFRVPHTEGITIWPLKRLRTRLSIPFGFLQLAGTRMKRSD
jgi:hypothetical protein